jgi:hypothetical protein
MCQLLVYLGRRGMDKKGSTKPSDIASENPNKLIWHSLATQMLNQLLAGFLERFCDQHWFPHQDCKADEDEKDDTFWSCPTNAFEDEYEDEVGRLALSRSRA